MAIALAVFQNQLATVIDAAEKFVILEDGVSGFRSHVPVGSGMMPSQMIQSLQDLKVTVLLCGAISGLSLQMIEGAGILVIPFLKGSIEEVAAGFFANRLNDPVFYLPGCYRRWMTTEREPICPWFGNRSHGRRNQR